MYSLFLYIYKYIYAYMKYIVILGAFGGTLRGFLLTHIVSFPFSVQNCNSQIPGAQSAEKALTKGESKFVSTVSKGGSFGESSRNYITAPL